MHTVRGIEPLEIRSNLVNQVLKGLKNKNARDQTKTKKVSNDDKHHVATEGTSPNMGTNARNESNGMEHLHTSVCRIIPHT